MSAPAVASAARQDGTSRCAAAPPPQENVSDSGIRVSPKGTVDKTEAFRNEPVPAPRQSYVREIAAPSKAGATRPSYRPPAPPAPTRAASSRPPARARSSAAPPARARSSAAPPAMPKPKQKLASVPPPSPVPRATEAPKSAAPPPVPTEARKSTAPPPVPTEARKSAAPPPLPADARKSAAPPRAPRADAFTPQPIPAQPVAPATASIDVRSVGVRRSPLPPALRKVLGDVRQSLGPEGRIEAREELSDMLIAGLRVVRHALDYTAELTVELELRLRT